MGGRPTLKVDGNLILASGGYMWLRSNALDRHQDLGLRQQVDLSDGGDLLRGVVAAISPTGDIKVRLVPPVC